MTTRPALDIAGESAGTGSPGSAPRVSIVLASCEGERYLPSQLESLARQTRLPDEVVVVDDASTDRTVSLIEDWARRVPFAVDVRVNDSRLGPGANFSRGLERARGEIVFLADQDDVWFPEKIERVLAVFARCPETLLVLHDQTIVDAELRPVGATSFEVNRARAYDLYDRRSFVAGHGCCIAVRRSFLRHVLPVPDRLIGHDLWLLRISALLGRQRLIEEPLQLYRRHERAVSLASTHANLQELQRAWARGREERRLLLVRDLDLLEVIGARLTAWRETGEDVELGLERLARERSALRARLALYERSWLARRVGAVRLFLHGDYRYRRGWKSFLVDFLKS